MATRIIEFTQPDPMVIGAPFVPGDKKVASQAALTPTTSPQQSSAFNTVTALICVQCDEATYVEIAANPTATTNSYRIQAGQEQFFSVVPGASWKASVRT